MTEKILARNYFPDPFFENGTAGYGSLNNGAIGEQVSDQARYMLKITAGAGGWAYGHGGYLIDEVGENDFVTASAWVYVPSTNAGAVTDARIRIGGNGVTGTTSTAVAQVGAWTRVDVTAPIDNPSGGAVLYLYGSQVEGDLVYWREIHVGIGSEPPEEVFSGDSPATEDARFRWEGTRYASPSIMVEREPERTPISFPSGPEWRYIAQRVLSNEFLHWDVPIDVSELRWDLSGPGALRGAISPDVANLRDADGRLILEPWGTLLYAEEGGTIRWGGIVQYSKFSGSAWAIEAAGFSSYPHGLPFTDRIKGTDLDPADVFRQVWEQIQEYPDGDLGVEVDSITTPHRIGTDEEPYRLSWWDSKDSGSELDDLRGDGGFDFQEEHFWDGDEIRHRLRLEYPRIGRKRHDLAFIQGDNVVSLVEPQGWEDFANEVFGIGAGEGIRSRRTRTPIRDGRLRRPVVYTDKGERNVSRLTRKTRVALQRHRPELSIEKVTVRDHPNARIGSWSVGDDVLVQAEIPWQGEISLWHRITGWELTSEDTATLVLAPSDSFTYGG